MPCYRKDRSRSRFNQFQISNAIYHEICYKNFLRLDSNMKSILILPECWHDDDDSYIKIVMAYV